MERKKYVKNLEDFILELKSENPIKSETIKSIIWSDFSGFEEIEKRHRKKKK